MSKKYKRVLELNFKNSRPAYDRLENTAHVYRTDKDTIYILIETKAGAFCCMKYNASSKKEWNGVLLKTAYNEMQVELGIVNNIDDLLDTIERYSMTVASGKVLTRYDSDGYRILTRKYNYGSGDDYKHTHGRSTGDMSVYIDCKDPMDEVLISIANSFSIFGSRVNVIYVNSGSFSNHVSIQESGVTLKDMALFEEFVMDSGFDSNVAARLIAMSCWNFINNRHEFQIDEFIP